MSTELATIEPAPAATPGRAQEVYARLTEIGNWLNDTKRKADHYIAELGNLLVEVEEKELYRQLGAHSFDKFLHDFAGQFTRLRPTQLYAYKGVSKHLGGHATPEQIEQMGIEKAKALAFGIRAAGHGPSQGLLDRALDPKTTVAALHAEVNREFQIKGEAPKGDWFELPGFFAEAGEIEEINAALLAAARTDPVVAVDLGEGPRTKECLLRLAREFLGSYSDALPGDITTEGTESTETEMT